MSAALRVVVGSAAYATRVPLSAIKEFLAQPHMYRAAIRAMPSAAEKRLIWAADVYRTLKVLQGGLK